MKATATGAAKDRMSMLNSDCTATSGAAASTPRRADTVKDMGIAGPRPMMNVPEIQARTTRITCITSSGAKRTRVLASATAVAVWGVVRMAFQLVPRCSTRHTVEASRATPSEQNIMA